MRNQQNNQTQMKKTYFYKGCVYVRCSHCGSEFGTFFKEPQDFFKCRCGHTNYFTKPMKKMFVNCECGNKGLYKTNIEDKLFDVKCYACKGPVTMEYNKKKDIMSTVRE